MMTLIVILCITNKNYKYRYQGLLDKRLMALRISCCEAVSICSSLNLIIQHHNSIGVMEAAF